MQKLLVPALVLLVAPLVAQTTSYRTSPPGFLAKLGETHSLILGLRPDMRLQQSDGGLRGRAMRIQRIDYRLADFDYTSQYGAGRSWSNVTLHVSEIADAGRMSSRFAVNVQTTPTLAFQGSMTWPTQTGRPKTFDWGKPVSFPFRTPWLFSGQKDLMMDWKMVGGVLANRQSWSRIDPYYYLEGTQDYTGVSSVQEEKRLGTFTCRTAFNRVFWNNFHPNHLYRNQTLAKSESVGNPPNVAIIHAWGHPRATPLYIAALCNPLYIDPYVWFQGVTAKRNLPYTFGGEFETQRYWFPVDPAFFHFRTGVQSLYMDTNGRWSLSTATIVRLPGPPAPPFAKRAVYEASSTAATGNVSSSPRWVGLPRYAYR